jgi:DNA-directed RNA polymerase subunit RPC12/RpoP
LEYPDAFWDLLPRALAGGIGSGFEGNKDDPPIPPSAILNSELRERSDVGKLSTLSKEQLRTSKLMDCPNKSILSYVQCRKCSRKIVAKERRQKENQQSPSLATDSTIGLFEVIVVSETPFDPHDPQNLRDTVWKEAYKEDLSDASSLKAKRRRTRYRSSIPNKPQKRS